LLQTKNRPSERKKINHGGITGYSKKYKQGRRFILN
jgi:hypothetical protein